MRVFCFFFFNGKISKMKKNNNLSCPRRDEKITRLLFLLLLIARFNEIFRNKRSCNYDSSLARVEHLIIDKIFEWRTLYGVSSSTSLDWMTMCALDWSVTFSYGEQGLYIMPQNPFLIKIVNLETLKLQDDVKLHNSIVQTLIVLHRFCAKTNIFHVF